MPHNSHTVRALGFSTCILLAGTLLAGPAVLLPELSGPVALETRSPQIEGALLPKRGGPFSPVSLFAMEPWTLSTSTLDAYGDAGTMTGFPGDGTEWVPGAKGRALEFDGLGTWAEVPPIVHVPAGTIEHWLRPDSAMHFAIAYYNSDAVGGAGVEYDGFGTAGVALEVHTGTRDGEFYGLFQVGSGDPNVPGSGRRQVAGGTVEPGDWTHVAMTWDTAGELRLYVDCQLVDAVDMSDAAFASLLPTEGFIGRPSSGAERLWDGAIDNVFLVPFESTPEYMAEQCRRPLASSAVIPPPIASVDGLFGSQVTADGDWLAVSHQGQGQAEIFQRTGQTSWTLRDTIPIVAPLSLSAENLLAGAAPSGASVYQRTAGTTDWDLVADLPCAFDDSGNCGQAVALTSDLAFVGSPNGIDGGAVYIFERLGRGASWDLAHTLESDSLQDFGQQVHYSEGVLAVSSFDSRIEFFTRDFADSSNWPFEATLDGTSTKQALRSDRFAFSTFDEIRVHRRDLSGPGAWGFEHSIRLGLHGIRPTGPLIWIDDERLVVTAIPRPSLADPLGKIEEGLFILDLGDATPRVEAVYEHRQWTPGHEMALTGLGVSMVAVDDVLLAGSVFNGITVDDADAGQVNRSGRVIVFSLPFFSDAFESGDANAWSSITP